ncbi:hypothetical protein [Shewanella algicola]|uniref:hypothetical protein n=1 Tax=Shewanella algicola TaxID=640633 RepID=UPI00249561B6|nr:hypothetical protein [Shewanella algicola]
MNRFISTVLLALVAGVIGNMSAAVAEEKEQMDEYHFRLCMMLAERLKDTERKVSNNFMDGQKYSLESNKIALILLKENNQIEPDREKALTKELDHANQMQEHHERKMKVYEDVLPVYEADFQKTCTNKQVPSALVKKHCSGHSIFLGEFCKAQVKAGQ